MLLFHINETSLLHTNVLQLVQLFILSFAVVSGALQSFLFDFLNFLLISSTIITMSQDTVIFLPSQNNSGEWVITMGYGFSQL